MLASNEIPNKRELEEEANSEEQKTPSTKRAKQEVSSENEEMKVEEKESTIGFPKEEENIHTFTNMHSKSFNKSNVSTTKSIANISLTEDSLTIINSRKSKVKEIDKDRPDIDRHIIDLALEHEIPEVLEILFKTISEGNRSTVIGGKENDYHALKQFIERSLKLDYSKYQANAKTKRSILKQLIEIDPGLIEIINEEINRISNSSDHLNNKLDSHTLHAFKNDFDTLCKQNPQDSLPFMACQSEKNSNSFLSKLPQAHTKAPSS